ncbi:hypothetical protein MSWAN_0754 [Methanobacterium paludis]|uniref:Uncharacterized protein n=1 Tax=Methanobacterium paludis (strain DSM 25820 / JCM 18151 / SWAN1) TaxID=868131 RepID=F6D7U9_METPW|nr:hypothetical protein MSWAN_0754 [Methanobacterium paludis]
MLGMKKKFLNSGLNDDEMGWNINPLFQLLKQMLNNHIIHNTNYIKVMF